MQVTALCVVGALLALVVKRGSGESALLLTRQWWCWCWRHCWGLGGLVEFLRELAERSGVRSRCSCRFIRPQASRWWYG